MDINQYIFKASDLTAQQGKIITIMGDAGVGKTTISHECFPLPVFIPIEPGLLSVPNAVSIQRPNNSGEVLAFLQGIGEAVAGGSFAYKTIILDSVSELETMASREVCEQHGVKTLSDIKGWGSGYSAVGAVHRSVREECEKLKNMGLHIVFIAHAVSKTEEFPDVEPYSRWILQVGKAGTAQYLNQVDAVIHVKNAVKIVIKKGDVRLAESVKNQRVLDMVSKPSTVAKNRFGITQDVVFNWTPGDDGFKNPLAPIFGFDG